MSKRKWSKEEVEQYRQIHGAFLYFNKEDSNIFIPKAYGIGWTINWANPIALGLSLALIFFVIIRRFIFN
jgi:Predicted membrane protein